MRGPLDLDHLARLQVALLVQAQDQGQEQEQTKQVDPSVMRGLNHFVHLGREIDVHPTHLVERGEHGSYVQIQEDCSTPLEMTAKVRVEREDERRDRLSVSIEVLR